MRFGLGGVEDFYRRNFEPVILSTPHTAAAGCAEVRSIVRGLLPESA